jgi:MFS family permease
MARSRPLVFSDVAVLVVVLSAGLILALMIAVVLPVAPAIASHFGGATQGKLIAQYFIAISGLGVMVGAPLAGLALDRFGFRLVVVAVLSLYILAGLAGMVLDNAPALLGSRLLIGAAAGGFSSSSIALLGHRWEGPARAKIVGRVTAIGAAAGVPIVITAGFVSQYLGWRAPFALYALALPLLLLALALPARRPGPASESRPVRPSDWMALAPIFIFAALIYVVVFTTSVQFPLLLAEGGFAKSGIRSVILASPSVVAVLAALMFERANRRLGRRGMSLLVLFLYGAGLIFMGSTSGIALALAPSLLCGLGLGFAASHVTHELLERAPAEMLGRASAALTSCRYLAQFLNPLTIGSLGLAVGLRTAVVVTGAAVLLWLLARTAMSLAAMKPKTAAGPMVPPAPG